MMSQNLKDLALAAAVTALAMDNRVFPEEFAITLDDEPGWPSLSKQKQSARQEKRRAALKPLPPKELTDADRAAMKRAEEKRECKAGKRRALASPNCEGTNNAS